MVFPYYLNTEEVANHVWEAFNWWERDCVDAPQLPLPLLEDYQRICPNFNGREA